MTIAELREEIAREEAVIEYLREMHAHYMAGRLSLDEALMRLKVVEEMEESWTKEEIDEDQGNSPFDSVADAEGDYK